MRRIRRWAVPSVLLVVVFAVVLRRALLEGLLSAAAPEEGRWYRVEWITDGDTIRLAGGVKVRLLGIDTPEKGAPYSRRATDFLIQRIKNANVRLEFGPERTDRYGRTLAWVFDESGDLINAEILRAGYGYLYLLGPPPKYGEELLQAQREARAARRGLWSRRRKKCAFYVVAGGVTHRPDCPRLKKMRSRRRVDDLYEALDSGAPPCRTCRP